MAALASTVTFSLSIRIRGSVQSIVPLDRAALLINAEEQTVGDLPHNANPDEPGVRFSFEKELRVTRSCWITLQANGSQPTHPIDDGFPQATTNPIWVSVGTQPVKSADSAEYFIRWVDKLIAMASQHPGCRSPKEREHVLRQFRDARAVYDRLRREALN